MFRLELKQHEIYFRDPEIRFGWSRNKKDIGGIPSRLFLSTAGIGDFGNYFLAH